ncbi:MAG: nucleotidyltransferase domain-containing protein [Planctomycetes bacterium]|nr:nucleotidyltransferase domain-containing protein [Planctomycetota bacterium]
MNPISQNRNLKQLPEIFSQFPAVEVVFVFGSVARGKTHRDSDLDLGIEGDVEELETVRLDMLTELARHGFDRVDLVFLRQVPPILAYEGVKDNRVVYVRDEADVGSVFSRYVRQYLDIKPYLRRHAKAYKERATNGQT